MQKSSLVSIFQENHNASLYPEYLKVFQQWHAPLTLNIPGLTFLTCQTFYYF